jgi:hypothetical protein
MNSFSIPLLHLTGEGRDRLPPWAPAFAGVEQFLGQHWSAVDE